MNKLLTGLFLSALLTVGCAPTVQADGAQRDSRGMVAQQAEIKQASVEEAARILAADPQATLIDVRTPGEYAEVRAKGAQLYPLADLEKWAPTLDPKKRYVVICRSGSRSMAASKQLVEKGFTDITNVKGGTLDWEAEDLPVERP